MLDAGIVMDQAASTAETWMSRATEYVEGRFPDASPEVQARLIASFMQAASQDQLAMSLRGVAEALENMEHAPHSGL